MQNKRLINRVPKPAFLIYRQIFYKQTTFFDILIIVEAI